MPGSISQASATGGSGETPSLSMRDLENEIVDISSSTTSRVKLLFAKSKGMSSCDEG